MNYLGSKKRHLLTLKEIILKKIEAPENKTFGDLFSGTGVVSEMFSSYFNKIIANDLEYYAYVLTYNKIKSNSENFILLYSNFIENFQNEIKKTKDCIDFFVSEYAINRKYFTIENAKKISNVRNEIEQFKEDKSLYYFLLASLLESADSVQNSASQYSAYLKQYKKTALNPFEFNLFLYSGKENNEIYNENIVEVIKKISGDVLYLDPPYNHRQYGANYHLLNTIALWDKFEPQGISGLRENYNKSNFSSKTKAKDSFYELIKLADFEQIFISYSNQGIISEESFIKLLKEFGKVELYKFPSKVFKSVSSVKDENLSEFIFYLEKK